MWTDVSSHRNWYVIKQQQIHRVRVGHTVLSRVVCGWFNIVKSSPSILMISQNHLFTDVENMHWSHRKSQRMDVIRLWKLDREVTLSSHFSPPADLSAASDQIRLWVLTSHSHNRWPARCSVTPTQLGLQQLATSYFTLLQLDVPQ